MRNVRYPDPEQYRHYTLPDAPTSRHAQARHVAGIVLTVAVGLGLACLVLRIYGSPPEWLKWAALALPLVWWRYTDWRDRRRQRERKRNGG